MVPTDSFFNALLVARPPAPASFCYSVGVHFARPRPMTQISGKTILITGGASGIGRQLALRMARQGGRVVRWDLDQGATTRTLEELRQAGPEEPCGYRCDVTDREQVYATAERVERDVGPVDILVNNAGYVSGKRLLDCDDQQIVRTVEVNALAHFWTLKAFLPRMVEEGSGHIVSIASAAGLIGVAGLADYSRLSLLRQHGHVRWRSLPGALAAADPGRRGRCHPGSPGDPAKSGSGHSAADHWAHPAAARPAGAVVRHTDEHPGGQPLHGDLRRPWSTGAIRVARGRSGERVAARWPFLLGAPCG